MISCEGLRPSSRSIGAITRSYSVLMKSRLRAGFDVRAANSAAEFPAILPKTCPAARAFPPNLLPPWTPPATSPAAKRPGRLVAAALSIFNPPIT